MGRMISWGPSIAPHGEPADPHLAEHLDAAWDRGFGIDLDGLSAVGRDDDAADEPTRLDD